jgi:hypothetical protein
MCCGNLALCDLQQRKRECTSVGLTLFCAIWLYKRCCVADSFVAVTLLQIWNNLHLFSTGRLTLFHIIDVES